jgi:hypothetical protein
MRLNVKITFQSTLRNFTHSKHLTNLSECVTSEATVFVRLEDPEFDESDHGSLFNARVGLFRAVGHLQQEIEFVLEIKQTHSSTLSYGIIKSKFC